MYGIQPLGYNLNLLQYNINNDNNSFSEKRKTTEINNLLGRYNLAHMV